MRNVAPESPYLPPIEVRRAFPYRGHDVVTPSLAWYLKAISDAIDRACDMTPADRVVLSRTLSKLYARVCRLPVPCTWCGLEYVPARSTARYCTRACQQQAYRDRQARAGAGTS